MAGSNYTRQSSFDDGDVVTAALFNDEYNKLLNAFVYASTGTTGHQHDGGAGEGGNIEIIGDQDFLNKILVDSTNNRWGFYVQVSSGTVEQIRIQDGAIVPVTDNDIDLGTTSLQFKDAFINGTLEADAITIAGITLSETIADTVGAMVSSNTETGITVSYQDADNTLDFAIGTLNQSTTGNAATATALATARTIHGVSFDGTANIDLAEVISDTVGAMFSSNTETGITVTYQDADNTIDLVVSGVSDTTGNAATATTLQTARTIGGTSFNGSANIAVGLAATATALATARTIGGTSFDGTANIAVGLAATATEAANVTAVANNTANETVFVTFVDGATGTQGIETDTDLTYNPSTGLLGFVGVSGTGAVKVPAGTTGQRPTAAAGQLRYNSTTGKFEGYTDSWGDIGGGEATFTLNTMTGDGSDTTLTMSVTPASENSIQVYFDGVYQHKDTFSFSGTTLTFSTAPASGVKVEVMVISTVLASTTPGDGTVTLAKMAQNSIDSPQYVDGSIDTAHLADDGITSAKLAHALDVVTSVSVGGASNGVILTQGDIALKNGGTRSTVKFYCESNNAHYAQIQAPAHSAFSGNVTLTLPASTDTLAGIAATQTLTNKTLTTPILTTPVVNAGLQLKNAAASAGFIEFFEDSDNGTNKVTLIGPAATADVTLILPAAADTLVGKATTDTLTNKTLTTPVLTTPIANAGLQLKNAATSAGFIEFFEDSDNGTNKVKLIGPASTADITLTLPSSAGSSGQSLVTNGSGVLSFATVGGLYNDWLIKTSGYTMVSGDQIIGNHASSAFTLTLPASPSAGAVVTVKNAGAALITIGRNSQKINSTAEDGSLATDAGATLVYVDSTIGWKEL